MIGSLPFIVEAILSPVGIAVLVAAVVVVADSPGFIVVGRNDVDVLLLMFLWLLFIFLMLLYFL